MIEKLIRSESVVERPLPKLKRIFRHLLNSLCDAPAVHGLQRECPQDQ